MSDTATPTASPSGITPATPVATPVAATPETVTLTKEQHDQLQRDAARASTHQRKANLYDRLNSTKGNHFKPQQPVVEATPEERQSAAAEEDRKAEQGLLRLAASPEYRAVLDSDATLRDMFLKNPLAVLPMLAPDALDAEDALNLVKEALDKRKPAPTPATPAVPPTPPAPPSGGVNPPSQPVNEEYEAARKIPNTENALAGMIKAKIKKQ